MKEKSSNWLLGIVMILIVGISFLVSSCTDNQRAKEFGGSITVNLEPNQKLVNVTWKDADMWILTRPMRAGEQNEIYKFKEKSTFGVMQGEITIVESGGSKPTSYLDKQFFPHNKNAGINLRNCLNGRLATYSLTKLLGTKYFGEMPRDKESFLNVDSDQTDTFLIGVLNC